jgi:CheY-like chemotaxis protein
MGQELKPLVLVVDDERHIVDLLTDLLEDEGYRVVVAYDGVCALEAVATERPDLVLADIMMPRLDGLSLVTRVREDYGDEIPVVLMSAAVTPLIQEVPYISKPFDLDDLLEVVERQLEAH